MRGGSKLREVRIYCLTLKIKNRFVGWGLVRHISMLSVRWWSGDESERRN